MRVSKHAVRRYRQRIGGRSAKKERVVKQIKVQIEKDRIRSYTRRNNHLYIETTKFTAVIYKGTVITILPPNNESEQKLAT